MIISLLDSLLEAEVLPGFARQKVDYYAKKPNQGATVIGAKKNKTNNHITQRILGLEKNKFGWIAV